MQQIIDGIVSGIINTSLLEWLAAFMGVASVTFSMMRRIWVYPTGIISVGIYIYLSYQYGLYADAGVNVYYLIMSIYGWFFWLRGKEEVQVVISANNVKENLISGIILIASFIILSQYLVNFTDSNVPYWDATTTSIAITGMWLMARKKIENWIAWILADLISIPLYYHKGLVLTSFQFLIFTILAIAGYFAWRKSLKTTTIRNAPVVDLYE